MPDLPTQDQTAAQLSQWVAFLDHDKTEERRSILLALRDLSFKSPQLIQDHEGMKCTLIQIIRDETGLGSLAFKIFYQVFLQEEFTIASPISTLCGYLSEPNETLVLESLKTLFFYMKANQELMADERLLSVIYTMFKTHKNQAIRDEASAILTYYASQVQSFVNDRPSPTSLAHQAYPLCLNMGVEAVEPDDLKINDQVKLGQGGFGSVFHGHWRGRDVAIKKINKMSMLSHHRRFFHEANLHAQLKHPHVVEVLGVCFVPGQTSLILAYMPQRSLYSFLHKKGDINKTLLYRIARDILEGLFYLHQQRVVHGDFKSDNVLLDEHTRAKISDFGSAEMVSSMGVSLCRRGTTLVYRAPELFNRSQYTSFSSDIYALGIVLWELIMRRNPHAHVPASDIERYVTSGGRDTIPSSMRSPYAMFVTACWSADMRNRPKDLRVFSHYLDRLIEALQKSTEEKKVHLKRKHASLEMAPDTFVKEKSSASFFSHPYDPLKCPSHVPCVSDDILGCRTTLI